jgi:hypothetical protein
MKKTKNVLAVAVITITAVLFGSCASSPRGGVPPELSKWINQQGDTIIYGLGISTITDNESDAYRQVVTLAQADLAGNLQTQVAAIAKDMAERQEGRGGAERIAKFEASTKQVVDKTVVAAKQYGPYTNKKGNTYIVKYIEKKGFNRDLSSYVNDVFAPTEKQLDEILGLN